jgi:hypothetical protein
VSIQSRDLPGKFLWVNETAKQSTTYFNQHTPCMAEEKLDFGPTDPE